MSDDSSPSFAVKALKSGYLEGERKNNGKVKVQLNHATS